MGLSQNREPPPLLDGFGEPKKESKHLDGVPDFETCSYIDGFHRFRFAFHLPGTSVFSQQRTGVVWVSFQGGFKGGSGAVGDTTWACRFAPAKRRTSRVNAYMGLSFLRLDPQNGELPFDVPLKPKKMGTLKNNGHPHCDFPLQQIQKGLPWPHQKNGLCLPWRPLGAWGAHGPKENTESWQLLQQPTRHGRAKN